MSKKFHLIPVLMSLLLYSCETARYFTIETQKPAVVTFPTKAPAIVVVNNAAAQPQEAGIIFKHNNKILPEQTLQKDSAALSFLNFFSSALNESHYFRDVLIYNIPLRDDNDFLSAKKISPESISLITDQVAGNAVLSIDRLLFNVAQDMTDIGYGNLLVSSLIDTNVKMSVYIPGQDTAWTSVSIVDTVSYRRFVEADSLLTFKYLPERFLENAAYTIAQKTANCFAPYWETSERVLYVDLDSRMKSAYAYSQKDHWEAAAAIWLKMYDHEKRNKKRGLIAINIAVSEEMHDHHANALEWVKKALAWYALEDSSKVIDETTFARQYQQHLEERVSQSIFLNRQLQGR